MFRSPSGRKPSSRVRAARRVFLVVSLFAFAASLPYASAGAWQQDEDEVRPRRSEPAAKGQANVIAGAEFVPGEVLVRFRNETSAKGAEASAMSLPADDGALNARIEHFEGSDIVRGLRLAKVDPARTLEAVASLAARPDVLYAEPNYIWRTRRTPNDPRYVSGEMYAMNKIAAPTAWNTTTGSRSVVVGVIDGGIDINHDDLKANIWTNPADPLDGVDNDNNGHIDDIHGWDFANGDNSVYDSPAADDHGTHVAGTIGAHGDNNVGVTGVNWEVSIVSIKVLGDGGGSTDDIISGYGYALKLRQAGVNLRVLNNSYGGPGKSLAALEAINQLNAAGILFVVAAGNESRDNFVIADYPANYDAPNVIAVASTNSADQLSSFSNFGERLVSIGAPGSSILSTTPNNTYSFFSGTSMSSPHVAGAAALVCAANPSITTAQLRGVLAFTGDRIPALTTNTTTGRRLNVANAMAAALENDATAPAPAGNFRVTGQSGRRVMLAWNAPGDDGNTGAAADYDFFFVNPTGVRTLLPTSLAPAAAGTQQAVDVNVPYINFTGTIQLRAYDNAGNTSTASVGVTIPVNTGSDPYTVTLSAPQPLVGAIGTTLVTGDDKYFPGPQLVSGRWTFPGYDLPFPFPFYGQQRSKVTVSTNGTLYFSTPPTRTDGDADDVPSSVESMQGQTMIAGLWDDIDINTAVRADSGIFVSQPDASRIIFRWQGVTFMTPRRHVNMEIELHIGGTIQMRYGDNSRVFPVVGISGGEPDAYIVGSHTREFVSPNQPISLSSAQTVTFTPRVSTPPPLPISISGRVTDAASNGVSATVSLSGSQTAVVNTDSSGNYSFDGLASGGNYTVTPANPGYTFAPPSISFTNLNFGQVVNFTATPNAPAGPNTIGFAPASYQNGEGDARATITVTRAGDTSGAATVDYRTTDSDTFTLSCADATGNQGGAYARCDFSTTVGTLSFAAGEINKTIIVPVIDDGHDEATETFQLQLANAVGTGTTLGAQNVATISILDNDAAGAPNPVITSVPFFVRQQYLDFLSREPEMGEPWSGVLARCPDIFTGPAANTDCDRIAVSRAFFGSLEFQLKGSYVFRFYKVAYGRLPLYTEIVADMSFVAGATEQEVYARKAQLATAFAARPEFQATYGAMTNAQFVNTLLGRYQIGLVTTPDPATPDSGTRVNLTAGTLINQLDTNFLTRAQVFRAVADSDQVQAAEFNNTFVAVQYYGYLRRTPEPAGYQDNLNALARGVSPREMVNAFLNSAEYRLRFGQP